MSGIYIHIPFCRSACIYCNFHFSTSQKNKNNFSDALIKEITLKKDFFNKNEQIDTLYFGGGTPSHIDPACIAKITDSLHKHFSINNNIEFTLEANPEDISNSFLKEIKEIGVNRLSIGVQSFDDKDLSYLKRLHDGPNAINSIKKSQDAGFENISIDLIYGIPTQSEESWSGILNTFFKLKLPHLSCYSLTVEDKTPLSVLIKKNILENTNDDLAIAHSSILNNIMHRNGYLHYEISNFSKNGFLSKHNTSYWQRKKYLGLGPSAHSFNLKKRFWNISNTSSYIKNISDGKEITQFEDIDLITHFNEYMFTSLRTMWGVEWEYIIKNFGKSHLKVLISELETYYRKELLEVTEKEFKIKEEAWLFADGIASDFFILT